VEKMQSCQNKSYSCLCFLSVQIKIFGMNVVEIRASFFSVFCIEVYILCHVSL
jgi:hypothetical protein